MKEEIVKLAVLSRDVPCLNHSLMGGLHEQKLHLARDLMQVVNGRKVQVQVLVELYVLVARQQNSEVKQWEQWQGPYGTVSFPFSQIPLYSLYDSLEALPHDLSGVQVNFSLRQVNHALAEVQLSESQVLENLRELDDHCGYGDGDDGGGDGCDGGNEVEEQKKVMMRGHSHRHH